MPFERECIGQRWQGGGRLNHSVEKQRGDGHKGVALQTRRVHLLSNCRESDRRFNLTVLLSPPTDAHPRTQAAICDQSLLALAPGAPAPGANHSVDWSQGQPVPFPASGSI
jgi:hypothetical protein